MFDLKSNPEIGAYFEKLVKEKDTNLCVSSE